MGMTVMFPRAVTAQSSFTIEAGLVTALEDASLLHIGIRAAFAKARQVGVDFAVATFPEGVVEGVVLLTPDLDVTVPIPFGESAFLMPRVGASALVGFGSEGGGAIGGYNLGLGVMGAASPRMALRLDLTYRRYMIDEAEAGLLVVSAGIGWRR
jgi:hypothetical protein